MSETLINRSAEIVKCEMAKWSKPLVRGDHGPLIQLHFKVLDTEILDIGSWKCQRLSS
jgi:hypothetical protein